MRRLLVIEDGTEYVEFARLFLADHFSVHAAQDAAEALALLAREPIDALLVDLRFERSAEPRLVGDLEATAERLFGGDRAQALGYLREHQGALVLRELRVQGHRQPAVFVHEFPRAQLANLVALYGPVRAVPNFDAGRLRAALGAE
jgi:CheY-like chemotaxis protein